MNERIDKLAKQAWDLCPDPYGETSSSALNKFEQKFAELIVRECANIALRSGSVPNKSVQATAEVERIYHKIQDHFGVIE